MERVRVATGPSIGAEPEGTAPGPGGDILRLRGGGCGVTGTDSHPPQVRSSSVSACVGEKVEKEPTPSVPAHGVANFEF